MRILDLIIIHCSGSPNGRPHTVEDIDRWHKEKGFSQCGYHYIIYVDGTVHVGRPIAMVGAHAEGYNARSIGICMIGTDRFSLKQWAALKVLVTKLQEKYNILRIAGHREIPEVNKECPGFSVTEWRHNDGLTIRNHTLSGGNDEEIHPG